MAKHPKPEPVVVSEVCSICGEDWAKHPEKATVLDCVEILKRKASRTPFLRQGGGWSLGSTSAVQTFSADLTPIDSRGQVWFNRGDDDGSSGVRVPA
jgi:hypothetical protein